MRMPSVQAQALAFAQQAALAALSASVQPHYLPPSTFRLLP
jgi:hypothetical protein